MSKTLDIGIRSYKDEDLNLLSEIRNNLDIQVLLITHPRPNSLEKTLEWIEQKTRSSDSAFFVITLNNNAIGFVQAARIDHINRTCYMGIAIHPKFQQKGLFSEAYKIFEEYLIKYLNIRKILAEILRINNNSLKAFSDAGFIKAGNLKEHYYFNNQYIDVILMEKFISL